MIFRGYKYLTEQDAINARQQAADYYGLPVSPDSITLYFVNYNYSEIDNFWYIIWVDGCTEVFGNPEDFEITNNMNI